MDIPPSTLSLVDLPLELFQRIVHESIQTRGIVRAMRLRLVSRLFSSQVLHALFLYNMLDGTLSLNNMKRPPFIASYLEHRVNNEPNSGNPVLFSIRQVAERLASGPQLIQHYISSLCKLAIPNTQRIFLPYEPPWESVSPRTFEKHVQTAAVYMNHLSEIDALGAPQVVSSIFGGSASLAAMYGSKEMLEIYLKGLCRRNRCITLPSAARCGRTELVRFIFNYDIEASPWRFDPEIRNKDEIRALAQALTTPDPNTWEFIMEMHTQYTVPVPSSRHTSVLQTCAQKGWTDMARHLLEYGTNPDACADSNKKTPIFFAAQRGHLDVVQELLDWNAKIHNDAMKAAAANGHLEVVKLLLSYRCSATGALVTAAQSGYGDIVKTLLENGADSNEDDGDLSAICYAIITEHTSMFRCLVEHGSDIPNLAMREECVKRARKKGVESMLAFLEF